MSTTRITITGENLKDLYDWAHGIDEIVHDIPEPNRRDTEITFTFADGPDTMDDDAKAGTYRMIGRMEATAYGAGWEFGLEETFFVEEE